jgi:hypothetical protein
MPGRASTTREDFEYWLADMDDALGRFLASLPQRTREHLDYSPESLDALEDWILATYPSVDAMRAADQSRLVDGIARYIGETFRKHIGGRWDIQLEDPKALYFGRPILTGYSDGPLAPLSLATATAHRRTGVYLRSVFDRLKATSSTSRG